MSDKAKTSKRVATEASEILRDPESEPKPKSVSGSALAQAPDRKKAPTKKLVMRRYRSSDQK
jgi:hypothetical protein